MITAWFYDGKCILINETKNIYYGEDFKWHELTQQYTTIQPPICKSCIFNGETWRILEEIEEKQIDICPKEIKTNEQLTDENKLLKAQIEALSANQDFYEECIVEMAALVYA